MTINWTRTEQGAFRYALEGDGESCLVLIHELAGSLDSWGGVAAGLSGHLPGDMRLLRYDQRGCGQSIKTAGRLSLDQAVADLDGLLDRLEVATPVTLCGAAIGSAVAVAYAAAHPDTVDRLILIGPALAVPAARKEAAEATASALEAGGMAAIADAVLPLAFPDALWSSEADKERGLARWMGADPVGYAANYRMLIDADLDAALRGLSMPVRVIAGAHDPFGTPEIVKTLTDPIAQREWRVMDAGHFAAIQSPDIVTAEILDALSA